MYLQMDKNEKIKLENREDYQRMAKSTYEFALGYYAILHKCSPLFNKYFSQVCSIASFSCELFLKSILYNNLICCRNEHDLLKLYNKLPENSKNYIKEHHPKSNLNIDLEIDSFENNLKEIGKSYDVFRYSYEKEGYACNSLFLIELLMTLKNYCAFIFNNNKKCI